MKLLRILGIVLIIVILLYIKENETMNKKIITIEKVDSKDDLNERYYSNNEDYYGYLKFDNNFINEPIVQGKDNIYYQRKNINKENDTQGTVFVDCNYQNEELMVIYGHNVYYDKKAKFSRLEDLKNQKIYEEYNKFEIKTKNETVKYAINAIVEIDVRDNDFEYQQLSFLDEDEFIEWKKYVEQNNLINNIHDELKYKQDKVILQTCVKWKRYNLLLVIAQRIDKQNVKDG